MQAGEFDDENFRNQRRFFLSLLWITVLYVFLVLTFPTWTVIRYVIPVLPAIYLLLGFGLTNLQNKLVKVLIFNVAAQNSLITDFIESGADVLVTYCDELKLGEKFWSITVNNEYYPDFGVSKDIDCINDFDVDKNAEKIENKVVYLRKAEAKKNAQLLSSYVKSYRTVLGNY